jgi:tetratricopeptide (TPR) repeat protein
MKIGVALFCAFLLSFPAFAQTPGAGIGNAADRFTALQNYRTGREQEANGRLADADIYYNETVRICQDEVSRNAANRDTYAAITWALQRQKKYRDVVTWGDRGLRLYTDEYRVMETMGEAYFYLDDYDRSLNYMQRYTNALPQGERVSVAYFFIGEIYRLRQQYRHADIAYTTAVRLDPGSALWWYRLATVREYAGEYSPAIEAYQRALQLNPNYTEARAGLTRAQGRNSN